MPYPAKTSPDDILAAALTLLETGGPQELTMRSLAAALGLRASSLYRHYTSREVLEAALATEGTQRLHLALETAAAQQPPAEAIRNVADAYLHFAREHPALYDLMHAAGPPKLATPGPAKDLWNLLLGLVGTVTGRADDTAGAVAFWAFLHGYRGLERDGLFGLSGPQQGLARGLTALTLGLALDDRA
ncbi:TetR/AcrR family transcriptional regulator [Deinococcus sp.]|uniref:TetR/AcrR family transcriptional regulator n=1 Tax=Deinococcus sp. TaxID=47478 RepID=UPI003CC6A5F5